MIAAFALSLACLPWPLDVQPFQDPAEQDGREGVSFFDAIAPEWQELFPGGEIGAWTVTGGDGVYSFEEEDGAPVLYGRDATRRNTFLVSPRRYGDFELEIDVKIEAGGNSGIQFRSQVREDGRLYGYQAEVDPSERAWSAGIYDEGRRGWLDDLADNDAARAAFRVGEWNTYRIVAKGPLLRTWVNGVPAADLYDEVDAEGHLALQVHGGGKTHVRWRNARIRAFPLVLPSPWPAIRIFNGQPEVPVLGTPGTMTVFGNSAMPILLSGDRPVPVGGHATFGEGQAVAIAHTGYAGRDQPIRAQVIAFLTDGAESPRVLDWNGGGPTAEELAVCDVLVMTGIGPMSDERASALREWVARGGALYTAVCPWGWQQVNAKRGWRLPEDLGENQLLAPMGMAFADGYAKAAAGGMFRLDPQELLDGHCVLPLYMALGRSGAGGIGPGSLKELSNLAAVEHALRAAPAAATNLRAIVDMMARRLDADSAPRPDHKVAADDAGARLAVIALSERWRDLPAEEVQAAPGAEHFPGAVAEGALTVTHSASVDAAPGTGWHSTGLYLAPGALLEARVTGGSAQGWRLRVGCHKDKLWQKDRWSRWPEITGEWPLVGAASEGDAGALRVATPFGGPVYLVPTAGAEPIQIEISGVVMAPLWRPGMRAAGWRKRLATSDAPWAELVGEHLILSVPTEAARLLDDPAPLMAFWDSVMEAHCQLGGEPLPARPERLVADVQISAGYMHSGYPIMTWLDVVELPEDGGLPVVLDLETLRTKGNWGYFHELGHNRQKRDWTFGGTGEVTCNLFSLHAGEQLCGIEPWQNPWLAKQKANGAAYLEAGADFAQWKRKAGVALVCYAQIQREFGWQPFYDVLAEYHGLAAGERPKDDAAKRDRWVRQMSLATGHDLREFHAKWGWPLGEALRKDAELAELPAWMPDFDELRE